LKTNFTPVLFAALLFLRAAAAGAEGKGFSFVVIGDTQRLGPVPYYGISPALEKITEEIALVNPDMIFHLGDVAWGYGEDDVSFRRDLDEAFKLFSRWDTRVYYTPGNHDTLTKENENEFFRHSLQERYYSIDYNGYHFIVLNTQETSGSEKGGVSEKQMLWLKADISLARGNKGVFVFMHIPIVTGGRLRARKYKELAGVFSAYKVKAVFAGHIHAFAESEYKGVKYIITGGGGAKTASPENGGFHHYIVMEADEAGNLKSTVVEPNRLQISYSYLQEGGKTIGTAIVSYAGYSGVVLPVKGLRFTLPKGDYEVVLDRVPPQDRINGWDVWKKQPLLARITKIKPSQSDPSKADIYVEAEVPSVYAVSVTLKPK